MFITPRFIASRHYNTKQKMRRLRKIFLLLLFVPAVGMAQIGEHRNDFSLGITGGLTMSNVGFTPDVPQTMLNGFTGGLAMRYTCEKYFNSICAIVAELNVTQMGWKEEILDAEDQPVINSVTGQAEEYQRQLTYFQLPLMARLGWGRERKGFQFFFQVGPQVGYYLSDKVKSNFEYSERNTGDRIGTLVDAVMDTMQVQNKFDYGIAAGLGIEYSHPKVGHFILEGRYYYGLGDFYKNSKADYFGRSNNGCIAIKLTYLFDITRTKNSKIK